MNRVPLALCLATVASGILIAAPATASGTPPTSPYANCTATIVESAQTDTSLTLSVTQHDESCLPIISINNDHPIVNGPPSNNQVAHFLNTSPEVTYVAVIPLTTTIVNVVYVSYGGTAIWTKIIGQVIPTTTSPHASAPTTLPTPTAAPVVPRTNPTPAQSMPAFAPDAAPTESASSEPQGYAAPDPAAVAPAEVDATEVGVALASKTRHSDVAALSGASVVVMVGLITSIWGTSRVRRRRRTHQP